MEAPDASSERVRQTCLVPCTGTVIELLSIKPLLFLIVGLGFGREFAPLGHSGYELGVC